jgi:hypothetical protein
VGFATARSWGNEIRPTVDIYQPKVAIQTGRCLTSERANSLKDVSRPRRTSKRGSERVRPQATDRWEVAFGVVVMSVFAQAVGRMTSESMTLLCLG